MNLRTLMVRAGVLLGLVATACTDLTVEPKSTISENTLFSTASSYRTFIAKVYAGLAVSGQQGPSGRPDLDPSFDEGFSQYVRLLWSAQELPTDEAIIGWNDTGLPELVKQTWSSSNGFLVTMYYRIFFQVGLANEFLRQTTDDKLSSRGHNDPALRAEVAEYRAEARFLRALSYWHGIDLFANIPLVTDATPLGPIPPEQATRQELYDFVVSELTDIQGSLPAPGATNYGRATRTAASMLLAKLYLNAGVYTGTPNYAAARQAAEAVIAGPYSLDDKYRDMFLADNHTSPEIVFAVTQDGKRTQTWGGTTFLVHAAVGGSLDASLFGINGGWWGLRLKPEAYNRYAAGDGRASFFHSQGQTVSVVGFDNFNHGILAPKYSNVSSTGVPGQDLNHVDTDYPMFRLSDAYLMYAEAVLRGGGGSQAQALSYVNALRQRAFGGTSGNITAGQLTLAFILDERGRELLWEGHRRTDLIRYGLFTGGSYIWAWKGGSVAGAATPAHFALYPLPANELIANPNLTQNPGY
jgi:starch-binding outer membrane protein, SusD/RagB family